MGKYGIHLPKGRNNNNGALFTMLQNVPIQFGSIGQQGKNTWAEVLGKKSDNKGLTYIPPTLVGGKPVTHIETKQFAHLNSKYEKVVVGSFIGKRPG
ncbi:hypothetical protein FRX31_006872, partial [Thalictrum thalictroides]